MAPSPVLTLAVALAAAAASLQGCISGTKPTPAPSPSPLPSPSPSPPPPEDGVDTFFLSDVHVGDGQNTWEAVEAAFVNFRKQHPGATYFVYAGDTIKHQSPRQDQLADVYLKKLISLATSHGFAPGNIWIAQGNNDGPHDRPLSPNWASAVVASGVVPASEKATALKSSYYAKCGAGGVCGIVINTDLEVYSTGKGEDKAVYNTSLTAEEYDETLGAKQEQHAWAQAKIKAYTASGQRFFMLGHHPQLSSFYPSSSGYFQGGVFGHTHSFMPTALGRSTTLPGYTGADSWSTRGYVSSSLNMGRLSMGWSEVTHYDYSKKCFYPNGGKCSSEAATVLV